MEKQETEFPAQCYFGSFGGARVKEIIALTQKLETIEHGQRAYQNLPRHMQRRAMSSNPKRVPRSIREKHIKEVREKVNKTKRPCRKYRRRPSNLLEEYNRRQKNLKWLETHIWHSKRFHMERKWGYALPLAPTNKGHRATLRAAGNSCLVQDISYMSCIELSGSLDIIHNGLSLLLSPEESKLRNTSLLLGQTWDSIFLYTKGRYPNGAIGTVDIMYHKNSESKPTIWIWAHPAIYEEVLESLLDVFELESIKSDVGGPSFVDNQSDVDLIDKSLSEIDYEMDTVDNLNKDIKRKRIKDSNESPEKKNKTNKDIGLGINESMEMEDSENNNKIQNETKDDSSSDLNKQIDTKNNSNDKLKKKINKSNKENKCSELNESTDSPKDTKLKKKKKKNDKNVLLAKIALQNVPHAKAPLYKSKTTDITVLVLKDTLNRFRLTGPASYDVLSKTFIPTEFPSEDFDDKKWWGSYYESSNHLQEFEDQVTAWNKLSNCVCHRKCILPLTVRDPRVMLPVKKSNVETPPREDLLELVTWSVCSPIYNGHIRDEVTLTKCPDAKINERRRAQLIPASPLPIDNEESRIPILLLHRTPPISNSGDGWDVIIPCGWGAVTMVALSLSGAVASGQTNEQNLVLESYLTTPTYLIPDTKAYKVESYEKQKKLQETYFRKPPTCRNNYIKLGTQYPFSFPWLKLLQTWRPMCDNVRVLRSINLLKKLSYLLKDKSSDETTKEKDTIDLYINELKKEEYLINIRIEVLGKGTIEPNAMICLPLESDVQDTEIYEPHHKDSYQEQRKQMKDEHKKIHNKLMKLRYRARKKVQKQEGSKEPIVSVGTIQDYREANESIKANNEDLVDKFNSYKDKLNELWFIPESEPLQMCSRKIFGYIGQGGFCYSFGKCSGLGHVVLSQLLNIYSTKDILIRNPNEYLYRWGKISLVPFS